MNIKNIFTPNNGLLIFMLYILFIPIIQASFCKSQAIIGWLLVFSLSFYIISKSKKITFTFTEVLFLALFFLLNVYYLFINFVGAVYQKYTYIFLLALLLSKVITKISSRALIRAFSSVYMVVMVLLVLEYIYVVIFGTKIFTDHLACFEPGVVGYKVMSDYSLFSSFISSAGMNSILLGSQTASQLSLIALIWFYCFRKSTSYPVFYKILMFIAILFLILSPTITVSFLCLVVLLGFGFMKIRHSLIRIEQIYIALIIIAILSFGFVVMVNERYVGLDSIMSELILPQIFNLSFLSFKEILLGVKLDKIANIIPINEVAIIHHFVVYGVIGVLTAIAFIVYNLSKSFDSMKNLDTDEKSLFVASVVIVLVFILSTVHYQVMFQIGLVEIFCLHLAYIISVGTRKHEAPSG
jgi:hypothetical protein